MDTVGDPGSSACVAKMPPTPTNPFEDQLNEEFLKITSDLTGDSFGIFSTEFPSDFGRESLSMPFEDFGRESLGIINLNQLDVGRESLAIFTMQSSMLSDSQDFLNNGFINSNDILEVSSVYSPSFNSDSLASSVPSKIYNSVSSMCNNPDLMNCAFANTVDFLHNLKMPERLSINDVYSALDRKYNANMQIIQRRIHSLPCPSKHVSECDGNKKSRSTVTAEIAEALNNNNPVEEPLEDSVFMHKSPVPTGQNPLSLFEEIGKCQDEDLLDCTQEPVELSLIVDDLESPKPVLQDTETIFKTIDRLVPPVHCEIAETPIAKLSTRTMDAKEILNSLSDLINEGTNEKQKSAGQHLLTSLAEIIMSSSSSSCSSSKCDSGHSSEPEMLSGVEMKCASYDVLDLRQKTTSLCSTNNETPLDLSLKSKSSNSDKGFLLPLPPKPKMDKKISASFTLQTDFEKRRSINGKPPRILNKGPLKATVPIHQMEKPKVPTTPEIRLPPKWKKTSTPINKLKPMAQSTPENPGLTTSPLARPKSVVSSPVITKASLELDTSLRTRSISDLKRSSLSKLTRPRSFSAGKEDQKMLESIKKARDNVKSSGYGRKSTSNVPSPSVLKENLNRSIPRYSAGKKTGKENDV